MQTTLIGLAIAVILALVAALVGPFVVDWRNYRAVFEQEASRLAGIDVRVHGKIDGRLLPSPRISLGDVEIGSAGAGVGSVRAGSLDIEFALGPLTRGEWRAVELRLSGPQIHLGLDTGGRIQAPALALNFDPQALSIERLSIVNGTLTLSDAASGKRVALERIWFNGDVRSLLGPLKGEGAVSYGGALFPYRITAGRYGDDGTLKLRVNVDPPDIAMSIESEGTLYVNGLEPRFEGNFGVTRPVGISRGASAVLTPPWRVGGKIKLSQKRALMEQVEFSYGSGDDAMHLFGTAEYLFGARPRLDGVISGRQIDLDRVFANGDAVQREPPAAIVRRLVSAAAGALKADIPVSLGVGIDVVTIGGSPIHNLRGDVQSRDGGWLLDRLEFRAPGMTQARVSGLVALEGGAVVFKGPASLSSGDPRLLAGWLRGAPIPGVAEPRPLRVRGDLAVGAGQVAIERMRAEFAHEEVTGRLVYRFASEGKPVQLDAELNAPHLDIDAVLGFAGAVTAGANFERPREVSLALEIGRATWAGYQAGQASLRLRVGALGLMLDRLSLADFGGASIAARGTIALDGRPGGRIVLDLDARDLSAVIAAAGKFAPGMAERLRDVAASLTPAKLQSTLTMESSAAAVDASVSLAGTAGSLVVSLGGTVKSNSPQFQLSGLADSGVTLKGRLDSRDNLLLARLAGLDRFLPAGKGPGAMSFQAEGGVAKTIKVTGRWTAKDLDIGIDGIVSSVADGIPRADLRLKIANAELTVPRGGSAATAKPMQIALTSRLVVTGSTLRLDDLAGSVSRNPVHGRLALERGAIGKVSGDLNFGALDFAGLVTAVAGFPPQTASLAAWSWPNDLFVMLPVEGYAGDISVSAARARLTEDWTLRGMRGIIRFDDKSFGLDKINASFAGGQFDGALSIRRGEQGMSAHASLALKGADAASLTPDAVRAPVAGRLDLALTAEGSGRSPATLIGSLNGSGRIALEDARLAGLDPRVFDAVAQVGDRTAESDSKKLAGLAARALDAGNLSVPRAQAEVALSGGQLRIGNMTMAGNGADASIAGRLDLNDGTVEARIALTGAVDSGVRPNLFVALRGPLASPERSIDLSALTGWLTMKAIERRARELEELEAKRKREDETLRQIESASRPAPAKPATPVEADVAPPRQAGAPNLPPPITITPAPQPAAGSSPRISPRVQGAPAPSQ